MPHRRMTAPPLPGGEVLKRLNTETNIWLATVRPDSRPHLVPVWFVWLEGSFFLRIDPGSVKADNLRRNPQASLALEDGTRAAICEGEASLLPDPPRREVVDAFQRKYEWDVATDKTYTLLVRVTPRRWLSW